MLDRGIRMQLNGATPDRSEQLDEIESESENSDQSLETSSSCELSDDSKNADWVMTEQEIERATRMARNAVGFAALGIILRQAQQSKVQFQLQHPEYVHRHTEVRNKLLDRLRQNI